MEPTVYIIDDHQMARDSVRSLLQSMDCNSAGFESAEEFLRSFDPMRPGCVVTDVRLKGMSGIELLQKLADDEACNPVIVVTGFANTRLAVRTMRSGALTLLEKPYDDDELWNAVREGLRIDAERRAYHVEQKEIQLRFQQLTPQERQVAGMIVSGLTNREMADRLNVSVRTVESRRHDVFGKMRVRGVPNLVKLTLLAKGVLRQGTSGLLQDEREPAAGVGGRQFSRAASVGRP